MIIPVKDRLCSFSLKERDLGNCDYTGVDSPYAQGKPRVQQPNHLVEATGKDLCHITMGPIWGYLVYTWAVQSAPNQLPSLNVTE